MTPMRALVISPSGKTNALGRAMCLADLASEVFDSVSLYAPDDGPLWQGARRAPGPVRRFASPADVVADLRSHEPLLVWVVKPLSTSWSVAQAIMRVLPMSVTALDLDDADEALSSQFQAASPLNRLRLHPWNPLNPRRIRRTLAGALAGADALTYASEALRDTLGIDFDGPSLCVPHPRRAAAAVGAGVSADLDAGVSADSGADSAGVWSSAGCSSAAPTTPVPRPAAEVRERIDLGFLGTVRPHKGIAEIEALALADPRHTLHVFRGALPGQARRRLGAQLVEHDVDAPMETLYRDLDVVVLPQDRSPGAQAQLPAKLLDAMRFGKPVVASRTAAIVEAAADTALYVEDWSSLEEVRAAVVRAHEEGPSLGAAARLRFERSLALEAQVGALRELVRTIEPPAGLEHTPFVGSPGTAVGSGGGTPVEPESPVPAGPAQMAKAG